MLSSSVCPKLTEGRTIAQTSSHKRVYGLASAHVGIVVERVALGQVSLGVLQFFLSVIIPSISRSLVYHSGMVQ